MNLRYSAIAGSPHSSAHDANITAVTPGWRKSQIPVVEQAIETAALMLGSDKSRGYCLEMICADFLAGACLDSGQPELLLHTISRLFWLPSRRTETGIRRTRKPEHARNQDLLKRLPTRREESEYQNLRQRVLRRDTWRCQFCGSMTSLEVHHQRFRSHSDPDQEDSLITLCGNCHGSVHNS